jgi:hypothetical protein
MQSHEPVSILRLKLFIYTYIHGVPKIVTDRIPQRLYQHRPVYHVYHFGDVRHANKPGGTEIVAERFSNLPAPLFCCYSKQLGLHGACTECCCVTRSPLRRTASCPRPDGLLPVHEGSSQGLRRTTSCTSQIFCTQDRNKGASSGQNSYSSFLFAQITRPADPSN